MHSYLFVGTDTKSVYEKILEFAKTRNSRIIEFDISTIDNVKEIIHYVNLQSGEKQLIYLPSINNSSEAAQNALLKTLEEEHLNITFAITTENEERVLETIRSRCEIIRITNKETYSENAFEEYILLSASEKIKTISGIKDRKEAIKWLKNIISNIPKDKNQVKLIEAAEQALHRIESNGNIQIQLTDFVANDLLVRAD